MNTGKNRTEYNRAWRKSNPEKVRENSRRHRGSSEAWRKRNRERVNEQRRTRRAERTELQKQEDARKKSAWREANPATDRTREVFNRGQKRRRQDPNVRLRMCHRTRVYQALRGLTKSARTHELLGCTIPELRAHLEAQFRPGMTWENYGPVWHVDHRRPCAWFDLTDPLQQHVCFHYTNLQPLFALENIKKGCRG